MHAPLAKPAGNIVPQTRVFLSEKDFTKLMKIFHLVGVSTVSFTQKQCRIYFSMVTKGSTKLSCAVFLECDQLYRSVLLSLALSGLSTTVSSSPNSASQPPRQHSVHQHNYGLERRLEYIP